MKLLTKINRRFLFASTALLAVCCVLLFFLMRSVIQSDVDENLRDEQVQIIERFKRAGQLPAEQNLKSNRIHISQMDANGSLTPLMRDTMIYDSLQSDFIPLRELSFSVANGNEKYLVTIGHSMLESDDLVETLLIFTVIFIVALFIVLYFINRGFSKNVWLPFNDTLGKLKSFDLTGQNKVSFPRSGINEFEELNQSLNSMTEKMYGDYSRLKEFTEDASHEIQTPLSIIRSKLEMLIQSENVDEVQMNSIQQINEAVARLSKLNAALLTLTKIGNRQFTDEQEIHLAPFIRNKLQVLDDFIRQKSISVSVEANENVILKMNSSLADLLFDNLIGNAIKHNIENGSIKISVQPHLFSIANTGKPLTVAPEKLFERFTKNDPSSDSLGLGLSIVKQICESCSFSLNYSVNDGLHTITLSF
ncbi:MAG: sensor histidine kinase [Chitinophagales bacterium]